MKHFIQLTLLLLAMILPSTIVNAHDIEVNGIYYNLNGTEATVTYQGDDYWEADSYSGDITIPETITLNNKSYSVTAIGRFAFNGCKSLKSVIIPNSVRTIDKGAFRCCEELTSVSLPNTVTTLSPELFYGCSSLSDITIPNSVTTIDIYAFWGCTGLTSISIPNSVTSIGHWAFANCKGIQNVTLSNAINIINFRTFANCTSLTNIVLPETITEIKSEAFYGCEGLKNISIPNTVTTIGQSAFTGCRSLNSINLPNSLTSIDKRVFSHCSGLKSIDIPASVTAIGEGAFKDCGVLTNVTIPNSVTSIDPWAFCDCTGLESVTLSGSITKVPIYTFAGCTALKHVICQSTTPPEVDDLYSFDNTIYSTAVLNVPSSAISAYRMVAGWNKFESIEDMTSSVRGDVNLDNEVNVSDINAVINCILSTDNDMPTADVNQDGEVNISDINSVIDIILHPASNDWSLQVLRIGGSVSSFALNDMPKMTCFSDSLIITTPKQRISFKLNDIQKITYSKVGGKSLTCSGLNGHSDFNTIDHLIIHFKDEDFRTVYLENLNALSTSRKGGNNGQYDLLVDSRDGQSTYKIHEIDSITFGSTENVTSQTYQAISITHLQPVEILPIIGQVTVGDRNFYDHIKHLRIAEAVRIADMMWEHGAGNYSVEQYKRLMERLCNVMSEERPPDAFNDWEIIEIPGYITSTDNHAYMMCSIMNSLLKHNHFYAFLGTDDFIEAYITSRPDKVFIAAEAATPIRDNIDNIESSQLIAATSCFNAENVILFNCLGNIAVPIRRSAQQEVRNINSVRYFGKLDKYWNESWDTVHVRHGTAFAHGCNDKFLDNHIIASVGTDHDGFVNQTNAQSGSCFPIGFNNDVLFGGHIFIQDYSFLGTGESIYYGEDGKYATSPTSYSNASFASLCFQMKADVKNADELLDMLRATSLTDQMQYGDVIQPLHQINPAGFFQQYLMPLSLPVIVGEGPYVQLEKGFYKGVIFDIPGAEVNIDGVWVSAIATNQDRIKSQDPFTLEWRLNVPKLISMGYGNNSTITGHVIVVDDQFAGLNLEKEFKVKIVQ